MVHGCLQALTSNLMNDISFLRYTSKDSKTTSLATCGTNFGHKQGTSKQYSDGDVEDLEDAGL